MKLMLVLNESRPNFELFCNELSRCLPLNFNEFRISANMLDG